MELDLNTKVDVSEKLEKAVSSALASLSKPVTYHAELPPDPDWSSQDEIEAYIRELKVEADAVNDKKAKAQSHLLPVQEVDQTVRQLLNDAIALINNRRMEIKQIIRTIEDEGYTVSKKTHDANERLAQLLKSKEQLERLAALEGTVRDLCDGFDSWGKARPYQVDGILAAVNAYLQGKQGFLDADDMGLGKTFKSSVLIYILSALHLNKYGKQPRIIWVTKKSLIKSNLREIKKWNPDLRIVPNLGKNYDDRKEFFNIAIMTDSVMVCSYEQVRDTDIIQAFAWDFVFIDEVHRLKGGANPKPTQIWEVMKSVCRKAKFMYFLSGTPIMNKAEEMWAYLHIFAPERFPSVKTFLNEFTDVDYIAGQMTFKVNVNKLMTRALSGQMIHRTKQEVGMQLPDKERVFYYLDMEGKQLSYYEQMRDNFYVWLGKQDDKKMMAASVIIAQINRLRQIALYPRGLKYTDPDGKVYMLDDDTESVKLEQAVDLVETIGDQVVIFSAQFNPPLQELASRLRKDGYKCAVIDATGSSQTDEYEQAFQQKEIDVLLINMMTGSEGLNLHKSPEFWPGGASHAIFLDLWWNPSKNVQAEDRIWRDGATEPVTIHILQCENSADAFVAAKVEEKEELIGSIMDRNELRPPSEWRELLQGLI